MPAWAFEFVALAAIWGASFLVMRLGVAEFGALPTAFVRVALASVFLLPLLAFKGQLGELRRKARPVLLVGLLNSAIPFACYAWALQSISTGLSSILNATTPLFGALFAWVWLKDKPDRLRLLGLTLGFAGVALLAWDKASFKPGGSGLAALACLLATCCYGLGGSFTRRFLTGTPPLVTATGSQLGASLGLVLPACWFWPQHMPGPVAWTALLVLAILCTGVAYVLYFRLIERAGPARALTVTFLIPVFAVLFGVLFLNESVTPGMLGCGLVIVCGTALATGLVRTRSGITPN